MWIYILGGQLKYAKVEQISQISAQRTLRGFLI